MTSLPSLQVAKLADLSMNDKMILVQYGIEKYENEEELLEKLSSVLPEKDIQRSLDTLIGTQRVRRIGPDVIQNKVQTFFYLGGGNGTPKGKSEAKWAQAHMGRGPYGPGAHMGRGP